MKTLLSAVSEQPALMILLHEGRSDMTTFNVGQTYSTRSACDHDCIFSFTILSRTAKTVTTTVHGKVVKRGLSLWQGVEQFKPYGSYSMCAIVGADDKDLTSR